MQTYRLSLFSALLFSIVVAGCGSVQTVQAAGKGGDSTVSVLQGKNLGVQGDSISALFGNAWQNVVVKRTGMSLHVQDVRTGRGFATALECWGQPQVGGTPGVFHASYVFPVVGGTCGGGQNIGLVDGETFSASLTDTDIQVIELGTNDQNVPLGQLGDATTAGTFYGNIRWVVETYLTAKPSLRVILVTPQYNGPPSQAATTQQYVAAEIAYGNSVGVPVINMFKLAGVNAITAPTLTRDGLHPSDEGFANFYGPVVAQGILQVN